MKSESASKPKPEIVVKLESALGVKFKGPFSDGREWEANLKVKATDESLRMQAVGQLGIKLASLGITKGSNMVRSTFAFTIDKRTHLGVDIHGLSSPSRSLNLVVYVDED